MEKKEFKNFLDKEMIITDFFEDENSAYAFYAHKKYIETGSEKYRLIGVGPLFLDKLNNKIKQLGSLEFHENHSHKSIFNTDEEIKEDINYNEKFSEIEKRGFIYIDDLEYIFDFLKIDYNDVEVYSEDFENEIIESNDNNVIVLLENFFKSLDIKYKKSKNKLIICNSTSNSG